MNLLDQCIEYVQGEYLWNGGNCMDFEFSSLSIILEAENLLMEDMNFFLKTLQGTTS